MERRLMVDIKATREAYNEVIVNADLWISRYYNLADAMAKHTILSQLVDFLRTGKVKYEIEQSVFQS